MPTQTSHVSARPFANPDYEYTTAEATSPEAMNLVDATMLTMRWRRVWSDVTPTGVFAVYRRERD